MNQVYFDSAATTKIRKEVVDKISEVMIESFGNPSSTHSYGRHSKSIIESCRKKVAKVLNVTASEIIFTSGGTEADNLVLRGAVKDLGVEEIISSKIEHHAVLYTVKELEKEFGISVKYVDILENGNVDLDHLETLLDPKVKQLVSLMHVNNEIGNILDLKKVSDLCQTSGALFHSDTVQGVGHFEIDLQEIPVDFLAVSAHKFHGPKGVGFAYIKKGNPIKATILGGAQEKNLRAGTESVHNIAGMEAALDCAYNNLKEDKQFVTQLKKYFIEQLVENISDVKFNGLSGDLENSTYCLVNVRLPISQEKAPLLQFQLDLKGIACSKGSACQSGSSKGSHVLTEILSCEDLSKPSIRFSFSIFNTKEDIDYVIGVLKEFIDKN